MEEIRGSGKHSDGLSNDSPLLPSPVNAEESSSSSQCIEQTPDQGRYTAISHLPGEDAHANMRHHQPSPAPSRTYVEWPEVVRRGYISKEQACEAYDHFVAAMLPNFPVIAFESSITALQLQQARPTLFLAMLSAGSCLLPAFIQHALHDELSKTFAERILVHGSKSIELIQALQVGSIWLSAPRRFKDLKHYQLVHCAGVMAIDIGISRPSRGSKRNGARTTEQSTTDVYHVPVHRTDSVEARRAWLACYFICAQIAQNLRRYNMIRWSNYLDECRDVLETSPDAVPSDSILCQWVRYQHIADDIGTHFSIEDPSSCASLNDASIQFAVNGFETQIRDCTSRLQKLPASSTLVLAEKINLLFLHEVALHSGQPGNDLQPPFNEETLAAIQANGIKGLTKTHIKSLSACLASIHSHFNTFLTIPVAELRSQPAFQFARLMYAAVVLVKLNIDSMAQTSDVKEMFSVEDFRIEPFLEELIQRLKVAAEGDACSSAAKFAIGLTNLRAFFRNQSQRRSEAAEALAGPNHAMHFSHVNGTYPASDIRTYEQHSPQNSHSLQYRTPASIAYPPSGDMTHLGPGQGNIGQAINGHPGTFSADVQPGPWNGNWGPVLSQSNLTDYWLGNGDLDFFWGQTEEPMAE